MYYIANLKKVIAIADTYKEARAVARRKAKYLNKNISVYDKNPESLYSALDIMNAKKGWAVPGSRVWWVTTGGKRSILNADGSLTKP